MTRKAAEQSASEAYYRLREALVGVDDFTDGEEQFEPVRDLVRAMMRAADEYEDARQAARETTPLIGEDLQVTILRSGSVEILLESPSTGDTVSLACSGDTLLRILMEVRDGIERLDRVRSAVVDPPLSC